MKTLLEYDQAVSVCLYPGEKAYPIYRVRADWSEAYAPGAERRIHRVGQAPLPQGRFWNGTGWDEMLREECLPEVLAYEKWQQWWPKYVETKKLLEPGDLTIMVKLIGHDVWCSGWFSHWTFDVGMSDREVLDSFERYVDRIQRSDMSEAEKGSLMGAEDYWRWHGCATGDPQGEKTEAPCRCPQCKARGVVRIDH